jgi:hypothetical protein
MMPHVLDSQRVMLYRHCNKSYLVRIPEHPFSARILSSHRLQGNSSVVRGAHLPLDFFPTVHLPNGEDRGQRIAYFSEVRNRLLAPLDPSIAQGNANATGSRPAVDPHFDKIPLLNDIFFSPLDAVQLSLFHK